jgi:fatty-acyl-CoA synthase
VSDQPGGIIGVVRRELERRAMRARVLAGAGLIRPLRPDKIVSLVLALQRWGNTPAAGFTSSAVRFPQEPAIIDERGTLTFLEVQRRTNAIARSLAAEGLKAGDNVAVMCRNHRYFIEATVALSKLGANTLYLNTAFGGPQLADVVEREEAQALIYDAEFAELLQRAGQGRRRFIAWEEDGQGADPTLEQMALGDQSEPEPPAEPGRVVILTSGTTGTPKGASRSQPKSLDPAVSLLSLIPMRVRDHTLIAAPLFHSWGFAHFTLGLLLSSTYVLQRRFDPEMTLAGVEEHQAQVLPVVPVMLQRMLALPASTRRRYDTSSLRVVAASGSNLPGELSTKFMDEFGDILYNLYGSTEVSWATIATPEDMRAAPGTAGRVPWATTVKILDETGSELPPGKIGRIFVANDLLFEGYTGGGKKSEIGGLMSTGDVGHFDDQGLLFVEGRDDEMIVSGGENVFPAEVEDTIARMDGVMEVAVIGVADQEFGQRLKAFVVKQEQSALTEDEVKSRVRGDLARFKVPREVVFLDSLPRNATGKIVKRELD